jgi:hypothetical protein
MEKPKAPTTPMMRSEGAYRTLCVLVGPETWSCLDSVRRRLSESRGTPQSMDDAVAYALGIVARVSEIAAPPTPKGGAQ